MSRPVPNPGILDIAPYTPGKSPVPEPGRKVFKLSANETPFGPSPKAIAVYKEAAAHLEDYPEGTSRVLREAIGRAYGLDPARIICGAGSDEILNLLAHTYLAQGDEAISTAHGFLVYPIATMANGAMACRADRSSASCARCCARSAAASASCSASCARSAAVRARASCASTELSPGSAERIWSPRVSGTVDDGRAVRRPVGGALDGLAHQPRGVAGNLLDSQCQR